MLTDFSPNIPKFFCGFCGIKTDNKKDFNKHLLTAKHKKNENLTNIEHISPKNPITHTCKKCNKLYKSRVGLWYHEKKCDNKNNKLINESNIENVNQEITPLMILSVIQQNQEFKNLLMEQNKTIIELSKNIGNNNNNNNVTNKTKFNLNLFLNETCKDAMNLTDFVSSIKLQLQDLENVGKNGYVSGISNIIVKNLNALEINKRPLHCSDLKREIMYVKDENKWEKEKEKQKLTKAINKVSYKNVLQIQAWQKEHPGCEYSHNKKNDEYLQIVNESMGAFTPEENTENINKIIKNVAKEVMIEKEM